MQMEVTRQWQVSYHHERETCRNSRCNHNNPSDEALELEPSLSPRNVRKEWIQETVQTRLLTRACGWAGSKRRALSFWCGEGRGWGHPGCRAQSLVRSSPGKDRLPQTHWRIQSAALGHRDLGNLPATSSRPLCSGDAKTLLPPNTEGRGASWSQAHWVLGSFTHSGDHQEVT